MTDSPPPIDRVLSPQEAADLGLKALSDGNEAEAIEPLTSALERNPRDPRLWQVLALLHRAQDELGPAMAAFEGAAALAPQDVKIVHGLARIALESGAPAVALYEKARALAPDDQSIILSLASAEQAEGRPDQAIQLLENELRRRPGWADGHSALAKLRWMMGEEGSYGRSFDEALAERPTELLLWRDYIGLVMQGCRFEEALAIVRRGREAVGSHPIFDAHEAVCRDELGDWQGAETLFQPLVRKPDVATAVYYIRHLLRGGRVAEAARIAEAGMAQAAPSFAPYLSIAWRLLDDPRWQWLEGDPSLVGVYDLGDDLDLDALAPRLRALHMVRNQPLDQSLRGGTQSAGYLFARVEPPIRQLRAAIVAAVSRHIEQLSPFDPRHPILSQQRDRPIRFSGAWSVRLTGGGSHVNHLHPGGWFSSAFYAAIPAESERGPEPAGWLSLGAPPVELGLSLEPFRTVEPKPGRLVLFPSTMWHGTVPFDQGERLTVAFDVATPRAQLAVPR